MALGSIAGSASLGMLIPPSVLLIVWGVISEQSIGQLFIAAVIPGILLAAMFFTFLLGYAVLRPMLFGGGEAPTDEPEETPAQRRAETIGALGVTLLIVAVLGGIWFGFFTPTEAAGHRRAAGARPRPAQGRLPAGPRRGGA